MIARLCAQPGYRPEHLQPVLELYQQLAQGCWVQHLPVLLKAANQLEQAIAPLLGPSPQRSACAAWQTELLLLGLPQARLALAAGGEQARAATAQLAAAKGFRPWLLSWVQARAELVVRAIRAWRLQVISGAGGWPCTCSCETCLEWLDEGLDRLRLRQQQQQQQQKQQKQQQQPHKLHCHQRPVPEVEQGQEEEDAGFEARAAQCLQQLASALAALAPRVHMGLVGDALALLGSWQPPSPKELKACGLDRLLQEAAPWDMFPECKVRWGSCPSRLPCHGTSHRAQPAACCTCSVAPGSRC